MRELDLPAVGRVRAVRPGLPADARPGQPAVAEPPGRERGVGPPRGLGAGPSRVGGPSRPPGVPGAKRGRPDRRGQGRGGPLNRAADRRPLPRFPRRAARIGTRRRCSPGSKSGSPPSWETVPGLCLLRPDDFGLYPVADYDDPQRDQLGHIPYTPTVLRRARHDPRPQGPHPAEPAAQGDRPGLR